MSSDEHFSERYSGALCGWFLGIITSAGLLGRIDSLGMRVFFGVIALILLYYILIGDFPRIGASRD